MRINWKVRIKNPYFWIGLVGIICATMGVSMDIFTSWEAIKDQFFALISNPFMLGSVAIAVIGYNTDFTTKGLGDSRQALGYISPVTDEDKQPQGEIITEHRSQDKGDGEG
jgi:holin, phage phi LC3 family